MGCHHFEGNPAPPPSPCANACCMAPVASGVEHLQTNFSSYLVGGLNPGPLGHRGRPCHCAIEGTFACVTSPPRGQTSTKLVGPPLGIARFLWDARELLLRVPNPTDACHGQKHHHTRLGAPAFPTPARLRRLLRQSLTSPRHLWAGRAVAAPVGPSRHTTGGVRCGARTVGTNARVIHPNAADLGMLAETVKARPRHLLFCANKQAWVE